VVDKDRLLPWLRRSGWAYIAVAVALALVAWRAVEGLGGDAESAQPVATAPAQVETAAAPRSFVHVAGAVRRPGVYEAPAGARVLQLIRLAGGPTPKADLASLNLAARVQDGQQILVPAKVPPGSAPSTGSPGATRSGPVSLSSASAEDLDALDGIGPTIAARIVAWRQEHGGFANVDQLLEVPGIGPGRLEAIRDQVVP
jgi:competence protein ComEA